LTPLSLGGGAKTGLSERLTSFLDGVAESFELGCDVATFAGDPVF
jgi:hypothetical protein